MGRRGHTSDVLLTLERERPLIPLWRGCSEPCPRPESASRPDVACSERISVEGFVSSAAQENGLCESRFQERKEKVTITT